MYYPMVQAFIESLHATAFLSPHPEFVGLEHYRNMLRDDTFWRVMGNSVTWTLAVVLFQNLLGLASAVLLNQNLPGQGFVRTLVLLPWVLPGVVTALLWRFMYDPQLGLVNSLLLSSGLVDSATGWLAEPNTAMAAVILAAVWKGFPFSMVIFLAALQGVDEQQLEAAQLDGANPWQRFIHVTIPSMSAIIRLNLLLTTIFTFNYFDMIWVTTRGGPLDRTHIFPTEIFELGFGQGRFGEAAAYGMVSVLLLAAFAVLYLRELTQDA
jgi:multiple sugar transport system permease protein